MSEFNVVDQDWAKDLELGVTTYTDNLFEQVWDENVEEYSDTLSGEPFCGCSTCFWREALFYLVPKLIDGYKQGKITVNE
jgi:hypothetical protein